MNDEPFRVLEDVSLSEEPQPGTIGYDMWLLERYGFLETLRELVEDVWTDGERTFIPARRLRFGDTIIERDPRGNATRFKVVDHPVRAPMRGIGHVFVNVGKMIWRYEPEALVEIV